MPDGVDSRESLARDVAAIGRISAIPTLLKLICQNTSMRFAAVARVTDGTWTACAVEDSIAFGLKPGDQLELKTTLCRESRALRQPIVIDHASRDPKYCEHHTPRTYNIESYISVPIIFSNDDYFGNLCAIDPKPALVSDVRVIAMFEAFAKLIAGLLENDYRQERVESDLHSERATAELREQFIAVLGHDLRSPLAAVRTIAEILSLKTADQDLVKMGGLLRSSTRRMSGLIDDVLDFARGRMGSGIGVSLRQADSLEFALKHVIDEAHQGNASVEICAEVSINETVRCDQGRVQQLLSNLLGNAITHGARGQPIQVEAKTEGGLLTVAVQNRGTPISSDDLPHIFKPYWRPATSKPGGGLGLGLYICSEIVRAHGGTLSAVSSEATGTKFVARIPAT